ncbi:hypothetical protein BDEG_23211 [Batrachochytrium dendrobatidis JEL423]|uniref:Peptidase A1 domain-containing protein n=1 Tax=Batrachochytrium dendrobatidis (strain JEL423) TaxID=403673 RepID=A0A177WGW0_BATDL|nr:hypothetical protein BDEG_23211 [Batrachochytrium dendrobatidis JEL423]
MLITLECVILALQTVAAVRLALDSPSGITSQSSNRLSKRSPVELGRDADQCFTIKSNVNGVNLNLLVESEAPGIIVPLPSSSDDVGLAIQSISSGEPFIIKYRDKQYKGVTSTAAVTIPGTGITDIKLPVIAVEKQSADSVGIDPEFDGIFGFAYSSLSKYHTSVPAMDVLYNGNTIPNNEIGIQLCPYDMISNSFINIGNTDITAKCGTDGRSVAWVNSPSDDRHTVNIKNILVNGKQVDLPVEFQKKEENGRTLYSVIQTCCTFMHFPRTVVTALSKRKLNKEEIKRIFWEHHAMPRSNFHIDWSKLPSFTIVMFAQTPVTDDNSNSVVKITLGSKDYMQKIDSEKFVFAVTAGPNDYAVLGISFMTRLAVTFDLQNKRIGFAPGCGCEVATDGYPTISNGDQVLWSPSQLPEQPSTSGLGRTSTLRRLSRLGSTLRGTKRSKVSYEKFEG